VYSHTLPDVPEALEAVLRERVSALGSSGGRSLLHPRHSFFFVLYLVGMAAYTSFPALIWLRSVAWCFSGWVSGPCGL
jgi:hypothetical protein